MLSSPSQRLKRQLRRLSGRRPQQANMFMSAGIAMLAYRFGAPVLGEHPDNTFIGFALAFFGLWQGAEKNSRKDNGTGRERDHDSEEPRRRRGGRRPPEPADEGSQE